MAKRLERVPFEQEGDPCRLAGLVGLSTTTDGIAKRYQNGTLVPTKCVMHY